MNEVMNVAECAATMKIGKFTVYRMAESGELPAHRVGNRWLFLQDEIIEFLRRQTNGRENTAEGI